MSLWVELKSSIRMERINNSELFIKKKPSLSFLKGSRHAIKLIRMKANLRTGIFKACLKGEEKQKCKICDFFFLFHYEIFKMRKL